MALSLKNRPAKLGNHINTRAEKSGDDSVPAKDIAIKGIMLTKSQLNKLLGDEHAHDCIYDHGAKPEEPLPWIQTVGTLRYSNKFRDCEVDIEFGIQKKSISINEAKVKSITLKPEVGGLTAMNCTVQGHLEATAKTAELDAFLNKEISVSIKFGEIDAGGDDEDDGQQELDMDHGADDEDDAEK